MPHTVIEIFLWLFGLCIGSFLNVVVYRLTVGLSIAEPRRSFCPRCRTTIAWYDNLPVLSWLLLRGRCRHCSGPISVQYPLVEALTGLAFVLVYNLLFVRAARDGLGLAVLPTDTPLLLAWLALVACLVACAVTDIASYTIDIRVTNVVLGLGIVLHAAWPRREFLVPPAETATAAAALAACLVGGAVLCWTAWRSKAEEEDDRPFEDSEPDDACATEPRVARVAGYVGAAVFVGVAAWLVYATAWPERTSFAAGEIPVAAALGAMFAAIVLAGGQQRHADREIQTAIEEERPVARYMVWCEFKQLVWAALAAVAVFVIAVKNPAMSAGWSRAVGWTPGGGFAPIGGAVFAIQGAVIGAAAGWLLRIVFTMIYGREAFGVGDIYILAAAGATAGWDIALLGLLMSVGIALAGWLVGLLLKSTAMIPFGPSLALGFVAALWWNRPARQIVEGYGAGIQYAWEKQPHLLMAAGGVMLIGSAAAIALSRLVRRWVAPETDQSP